MLQNMESGYSISSLWTRDKIVGDLEVGNIHILNEFAQIL